MEKNSQIRILSLQGDERRMREFLQKWNVPESEWESMIESAREKRSVGADSELSSANRDSDSGSENGSKELKRAASSKKKKKASVSEVEIDDSLFFQQRVAIPLFVRCMLSASRSKFDFSMVNFSLARFLVELAVDYVKSCDKEAYDYFLPYINKYFKNK